MFEYLREKKEDFKAWRRGEKRVASGMRGRVYERKDEVPPSDGVKRSGNKHKLKVSAKVTRADGSVENYVIVDGKPVRV